MRKVRAGIQKASDHGQYIYAYCNIRTNQVLYSLNRNLQNNSVLKQLPDLGANNSPASLRKDLWHPLYTLALPSTPEGRRQGLHAYKKLREWRMLHETQWQPSALLSSPFTAEQREKLQEKLDDRTGSKKENVYDLIKRAKKKLRIKEVQNQKANSVADLAAVLIEQEEIGALTLEQKEVERERERQREVREMLALAREAEEGRGLAKLGAKITALTEAMERAEKTGEPISKTQTRREIRELSARRQKMEFALNAVQMARQSASPAAPKSEQQQDEDTKQPAITDKQIEEYLPSFPQPSNIPKRGWLRAKLDRENRPIYSTEGVTVKWQNILDAEFAQAWPENVKHEILGFSRHTAPKPEAEPQTEISDFKAAQWRRRQANWLANWLADEHELGDEARARQRGSTQAATKAAEKERLQIVRGEIMAKVQEVMGRDERHLKNLKRSGLSTPALEQSVAEQQSL